VFELRFFQTSNGECLALKALRNLPKPAQAKAYVRIERLAELGNKLTRPESDYLRNGIYELRWRFVILLVIQESVLAASGSH
jgi:phage-related protein